MNEMNSVFIATRLDGYIADKKGGPDWLHSIPNPGNDDMGYTEFTSRIDAIVMGGGSALFGELPNELKFELITTKTFLNQISQNHYKRKK